MNYFKPFIAILAIMLAGCATKTTTKELKTESFNYEGETAHSSVHIDCAFPVGGDEALCDSVYFYILSNMTESQSYEEDVPDFRNDGQGFADFFGDIINQGLEYSWQAFTEGDEDKADNSDEEIIFSVDESTANYFTYHFYHSISGIGDGFVHQYFTSFLTTDASRVTNKFLFRDPSSPELLDLVRKVLKKQYCKEEDPFVEEEFIDNISNLPRRPFYLTKEGVGFVYEQYEVYMMDLGATIPLEKIEPFLTDEALKLFD